MVLYNLGNFTKQITGNYLTFKWKCPNLGQERLKRDDFEEICPQKGRKGGEKIWMNA